MTQRVPYVIADFDVQLATAVSIGATSFTLSSATDDDGNALPSGLYCFTIDNGNSAKEYLLGSLSSTTVSSVKSISRQGVETTGASLAHRAGASVIMTDFIALTRVADTLRGAQNLDGSAPLSYDATPTLSDPKQLATVQYVLDVATGGSLYFSSQTISAVAGETLVAGNVVYFKESDQRWWKTDADTSATYLQTKLGVSLGSASAGGAVTVQISGIADTFTSLTAGSKYYLSNTAGGVSTSAGTTEVFFGIATSTTAILMAPREIYIPSATEKTLLTLLNTSLAGFMWPFGGSSIPSGWLECDGSAVSRTTYSALFTAISTTWGVGDGSTTFNVPDLRGRTIIGAGANTWTTTFASTDVNTGTDVITVPSNTTLYTGTKVRLTTTGALPTGLSAATDYYVIRASATTIQLATTRQNALGASNVTGATSTPVAINLTAAGSGTNTITVQDLSTRTLGERNGEEDHTQKLEELVSHSHVQVATAGSTSGSGGGPAATDNPTGATGGNAPFNIMSPHGVAKWCIKT